MTEREKWEAGLWYDANFDPELCAEREKAEELYTESNQTRPSEKAKRAELLHKLLPGMAEDVVILPHFYTDYGSNCSIGAGTYINHGAYLMDCAKITLGEHCFIGPNCGMYTAIHPMLPQERNSGLELCKPITLGDNVWLSGNVTILPGVTIGEGTVKGSEGAAHSGSKVSVADDQNFHASWSSRKSASWQLQRPRISQSCLRIRSEKPFSDPWMDKRRRYQPVR